MAQQSEQPSKVEGWAYPFPLKTTNITFAPEAYLRALAVAEDGFYPLGANGLWHGGIHFGAQTAGKFEQDGGVRCIADGEVVAFRLDGKLQEVAYPDGIKAGYSKGFTLVRHRLVLPPAPQPPTNGNAQPQNAPATTPPAAQNTTPPAQDVLTFFSLYMHTLPLEGYGPGAQPNGPAKTLPGYYGATETYVVGTNARDPQLKATGQPDGTTVGLRVRASHSGHAAVIGWLPRDTKIKIGQRHGAWGKISSFVAGASQPHKQGETLNSGAAQGWVYVGEMDKESKPSAVDQIYVLPKPHKIAAGETVAWIGEYQRLVEARAHHTLLPKLGERPLLHVEVFTADDLNAFISRSRTRAQQLDAKSRTLLLISKGAKLVQPAPADSSLGAGVVVKATADSPDSGPWCKVQKVNAAGHPLSGQAPLWIARTDLQGSSDRQAWSHFPLSVNSASGPAAAWTRVVATGSSQLCSESEGKTWYAVSIADENNAQVDGWVCDHGHPLVELKSPWDWPGFDVVNLATSVSDMFQRALFVADIGTPDEIASFEDSFNTARSDETIRKLEDAIDGQGQHDGKITARELQLALGKPWLADRIDHLIVRYESEWGGEMSKWEALNPHMHAGLPVWQAEMKRIDGLRFWSGVQGITGWPSTASVFHFHPVGIVGNFISQNSCACGCCLSTKIQVTSWNGHYGPVFWGTLTLESAPGLQAMLASGEITASEKRIIAAMAPNEGKLDTVQSYDNQVATAGAMQKTIRPDDGGGELSTQVADFRAESESAYQELFARCGWTVEGTGSDARMSFTHPEVTDGQPMTGEPLLRRIRRGCDQSTYHHYLPNPAIAVLAHALSDVRYQKLQLRDFVKRLRQCMAAKPTGYAYTTGEYFQGDLGRATVLDESVNRPGHVADDLASSLDHLYSTHPTAPRNPNDWGQSRATLERALADHYGITRRMATSGGVPVAPGRYNSLKATLG